MEAPWPCLVGPTGVGKSEIAYEIAKKLGYEILSCDAFQVYKELAVGTAQPPLEWQKMVPHHLVGTRNPRENWSAGDFAREADAILREKQKQGVGVILVGGSGFYLRALITGPPVGPLSNPALREKVQKRVETLGLEGAHGWLKTLDVGAADRIHVNDRQRICRALEKALTPKPTADSDEPAPVSAVLLGVECGRDQLDVLLMQRCRKMWKEGLLEEAKSLQSLGLPAQHSVWKAIGYLEALAFLNRELSEAEALEKMFRRTRQYAKRQWTWFRNQHEVQWFQKNPEEPPKSLIEQLALQISRLRREK